MPKLICDITMSLDGFIAGPNPSLEQPLGEGGDRLHQWAYELESFRERHGLEGGISNRVVESPAVTHLRYRDSGRCDAQRTPPVAGGPLATAGPGGRGVGIGVAAVLDQTAARERALTIGGPALTVLLPLGLVWLPVAVIMYAVRRR
jgi:hypothetical protein